MDKAAAYLRVSTPGQVKGDSLDLQEKQVIEYIERQGWELGEIVIDAGISGAMAGRDGFNAMIEKAKAGQYQRLVAYKVDRFIRHGANRFGVLMDDLRARGVHFVDLSGFTSENKEGTIQYLLSAMQMHFAAFDAGKIKANTWDAKQKQRKDGRLYEGKPLFGYKYVRYCRHDVDIWECPSCRGNNRNVVRGEFVKDPEQESVYLRIVSMYLDRNMSIKRMSADLKAEGHPMSEPHLSRILKAEIYTGTHYANKYVYEQRKDANGEPGGPSRKTNKLKPRDQWIMYRAPAMIDKATWDRIQEKRARNRIKTKRDTKLMTYWLRDALTCGTCRRAGHRSAIKPKTVYRRGKPYRYYVCQHYNATKSWLRAYGRQRCQLKRIKADDLEAAVWKSIKRVLLVGENVDIFASAVKWDRHIKDQMEALEAKAKTAEKILTGLYRRRDNIDAILDKELSPEQLDRYLAKEQDLDGKIRTQEAVRSDALRSIKDIQADHEQQKAVYGYMAEHPQTLAELGTRIEQLSPEDKKELVDAMLTAHIVIDSNLKGEWRIINETKPRRVPIEVLRELGTAGKLSFRAGRWAFLPLKS